MATFKTLELAIEFYEITESLKIKGHLRDQLLRASSSISLNLAEGNSKPSVKEKKRYYQTAYGSCQECKTIFRLLKSKDLKVDAVLDHLGASIFKLLKADLKEWLPNKSSGSVPKI